jgi:hypothetical protein
MASRQFYMPQFFADAEKNKGATDLTRKFRNGDNSQFLAFVAQQLKDIKPAKAESPSHAADGTLAIALLGCYGMFGYGLRRSQEVIRLDRGPSYWSHALIFPDGFAEDKKAGKGDAGPWVLEAALHPPGKLNDWVYRDGVAPRRFSDYSDPQFTWQNATSTPNIAVISVAQTAAERDLIRYAALHPETARLQYDFLGLAGHWFSYLTNRPEVKNPLSEGQPIPASAYVQMAYSAAKIDLAPSSLPTIATPEHFWSFATQVANRSVFWSAQTNVLSRRDVRVWSCIRDPHCMMAPDGNAPPTLEDLMHGAA